MLVVIFIQILDFLCICGRHLAYYSSLLISPLLSFISRKLLLKQCNLKIGEDLIIKDWKFYSRVVGYHSVGIIDAFLKDEIEVKTTWLEILRKLFPSAKAFKWWVRADNGYLHELRWHWFNLQKKNRAVRLKESVEFEPTILGFDMLPATFGEEVTTLQEAKQRWREAVCETLKLDKGMNVLDLNPGRGELAEQLINKYQIKTVTAVVENIVEAEMLNGKSDLIKVVQAEYWEDLATDPSSVEAYDRIILTNALLRIDLHNLSKFMGFLSKALKPGGMIFVQEFLLDEESGIPPSFVAGHQFYQWGHYLLSLQQIKTAAAAQGLQIETTTDVTEDAEKTAKAISEIMTQQQNSSIEKTERSLKLSQILIAFGQLMFELKVLKSYQLVLRKST